jgi:hypothetical protein
MTAILPLGASHLTAASGPLECAELVVDLDAQRLERLLGRMTARAARMPVSRP